MLQGNTYKLPVQLEDINGNVINSDLVQEIVVTLGNLEKQYTKGDFYFDEEKGCWVIPLTEQETFKLNRSVKWQLRVLFKDGTIDGTEPKMISIIDSINKTILSGVN